MGRSVEELVGDKKGAKEGKSRMGRGVAVGRQGGGEEGGPPTRAKSASTGSASQTAGTSLAVSAQPEARPRLSTHNLRPLERVNLRLISR